MKTLKQIKSEITSKEVLNHIAKPYYYKMGGTRKLFVDGQKIIYVDDREYYSGRRHKTFNTNIRHDEQTYNITQKEYDKAVKEVALKMFEAAKNLTRMQKEKRAKEKRINDAKKRGVYDLYQIPEDHVSFVDLSDDEILNRHFDAKRLANTLKISVDDALLLNSEGKTYVFAKSEDGNVYELYHSSLDINYLSISISVATQERMNEFSPAEWQSAPYAHLVGQTENDNHFVC